MTMQNCKKHRETLGISTNGQAFGIGEHGFVHQSLNLDKDRARTL